MNNDFVGFSFDGIHSSILNIHRVSNSDRYNEFLTPEIEDIFTPIPGANGSYFYGSHYRNRTITVQIAFDSVTETQFRQIRRLFSTQTPRPLIFDERPYKVYTAKIASPIELNYICFDEHARVETDMRGIKGRKLVREVQNTHRTYKGEGTIEFICTSLYARAPFKILDAYEQGGYPITQYENVSEWAESSGLLTAELYNNWNIDKPILSADPQWRATISVYNPGDIDTPFKLYLPFDANGDLKGKSDENFIVIKVSNEIMVLKQFKRKSTSDTGILINTENHLIEGVNMNSETDTWYKTGTVYNEYIYAGDFAKILHSNLFMTYGNFNNSGLVAYPTQTIYLDCKCNDLSKLRIYYNYLYY